jgi:hypothetical protein
VFYIQNEALETRDYLFLQCPFAANCWGILGFSATASLDISERSRAKSYFS